jgi:DNA-binding transcriptional ArsR family regulator
MLWGIFSLAMMETFKALAEPNRFQIVELLLAGPRPVGEMASRLRLRQPQVSKHLRVLSEAKLVDVRVDKQRRIYALRAEPLQELQAWLARYRNLWEENFQRLDSVLEELQAAGPKPKQRKRRPANR